MLRRVILLMILLSFGSMVYAAEAPLSKKTRMCLGCHTKLHPGLVADWRASLHSLTTPVEALAKPELERRMSATELPEAMKGNVVGCYECHGQNSEAHADSFKHNGITISVVVSPGDCKTCHPVEVEQYVVSKKGNAYGNLMKNPVYHTLVKTVLGLKEVEGTKIKAHDPSDFTRQEACFACHGTEIKVKGMKEIDSPFGKVKVPDLYNWPNQGVGRINPDGTMGACTSCHARHAFSIEVARKPHTCGQCHLEPDVPAFNVWKASKHGNIYFSDEAKWDFNPVPWKLGEDFTAPTCAVCHVGLVTSPDGKEIISERSHDFASRLWVRLFGLVYTHPQPKSGDTSIIRNKDGLPLPTTFTGEPALEYLIDKDEQARRKAVMVKVCRGCHNTDWIEKHFAKMDNTLIETDKMTLEATKLLTHAWENGIADDANPFDESIEQKWVKQWLFYGDTARYASAMTGAQDYLAFKYGWWGLTNNLLEMKDKVDTKIKLKGKK
jgi:hypothetical protein